MDLGDPVLMFLQKNLSSSLQYLGPQNIPDLLSFVKEQVNGGPTVMKVMDQKNTFHTIGLFKLEKFYVEAK